MLKFKGKIWKFNDNINTDLIVSPEFLTTNDSITMVEHAFESIRPGFSNKVKKGDIIVAGKNFGSGSSREEAVFVVKQLGISAVIAKSFSRIYFRNLINLGIPAITIPNVDDSFKDGDLIEIDLGNGSIATQNNEIIRFTPLPKFIMNIIEKGGTINFLKTSIKER